MLCFVCGRNVETNSNYFCRGWYHNLKDKLSITSSDFRKYLPYGLGMRPRTPEDWDFKQMHERALEKDPKGPNLFKLR